MRTSFWIACEIPPRCIVGIHPGEMCLGAISGASRLDPSGAAHVTYRHLLSHDHLACARRAEQDRAAVCAEAEQLDPLEVDETFGD